MQVEPIRIDRSGPNRIRISAKVDDRELWFDVPETGELPKTYADSFMIMGLAGSMLRGEPLRVSPKHPVSTSLLDNLATVQDILHCWNPRFRRIPIDADACAPSPSLGRVGSTFSGGVDSLHTLSKHGSVVDCALFIAGFDFDVDNQDLAPNLMRKRRLAELLDKPMLLVQSNQMVWGWETGVARNFWNSGYLAAATLFLRFEEVLIPSSHTWGRLEPSGSHPLLDPLWSNGATRFRHADPEVPRTEKIARIASDPRLLAGLHVCWKEAQDNCGRCEKCLRTMTTLEILGVPGPFPRRLRAAEIGRLRLGDGQALDYAIENVLLAHRRGRRDIVRALKRSIRRYDREKAMEYFDRGFLHSTLHAIRKRVRPYDLRAGLVDARHDLRLQPCRRLPKRMQAKGAR